jgi:hypothetical protein
MSTIGVWQGVAKRQVLIYCGGGLGNRFGSITGGLRAAWALGFTPTIYWSTAPACGASLQDLFAHVPAEVIDDPTLPDWPCVSHRLLFGRTETIPLERVTRMKESFIYTSHHWLHDGRDVMQQFTVQPEIQAHVDAFCAQHGINKSWDGIHVRGTDAGESSIQAQKKWAKNLVRHSDKAFLCSDDTKIEAMFAEMKNVVLHPKTHPMTKANPDLPWRLETPKKREYGDKKWHYNVNRHRASVIEALQDAMILARTTIHCRKRTFCNFAKSLQP